MAASRKPGAKGPSNQSRAAGAPARASAAAKAPMEGAHGGAVKPSFYDPAPTSQLASAPEPDAQADPVKVAGFQQVYAEQVRSGSMPIERGGSVDRAIAEHMAADAITDQDELVREIERIRQTRRPIGAYSQKLALPKRNGYHRHWFNDTAGRIEEAENNGWTFIKGKDGKNISRCVGTGRDKGAMYAFAMEIPEVFWLEDMAARNAAATDKVDALKSTPFRAKAGEATAADRGKFYDPSDTAPLQVVKG
jgi:hypothetical protein